MTKHSHVLFHSIYIGCCLSLGIGLLGSYGDHSDDEGKKA